MFTFWSALLACSSVPPLASTVSAPIPERAAPPAAQAAPEGPMVPTAVVSNPESGAQLAVYVSTPSTGAAPWPALVVVPGGFEPGLKTLSPARQAPYLETGFALVVFDPDGRGQSTGTEDRGGQAQQSGLAAVIDWAAHDSRIDPERIGLVSFSYGITMAAGVLATHTAPIRFLLDWEGPANRDYTHGCHGVVSAVQTRPELEQGWGACDDEAFWAHREASTSIGRVRVPYQRVQFARDHNQSTHQHAIDMVTAAREGGVPWVRMNDEAPNKAITSDADFTPVPNTRPMHLVVAHYAKELMEMTTHEPVAGQEPEMQERPPRGAPPSRPGAPRRRP